MADAPALGAGAAKAAWRFDPSLAYQDNSRRSDRDILPSDGSPMRTIIHRLRTRDLWMVLGLIALAVGLPAIVGIASGAIAIPRNDDFAYRRAGRRCEDWARRNQATQGARRRAPAKRRAGQCADGGR